MTWWLTSCPTWRHVAWPCPDPCANHGTTWWTCVACFTDLLPLSVTGIFFRHTGADILFPPFFFDGSSSTAISDGILARFGDDYTSYTYLHDHCNGFLLINKLVINPATLQCATLPEQPLAVPYFLLCHNNPAGEEEEEVVRCQDRFLAFDPTVSVYYEVYSVPRVPLLPRIDGCNKTIKLNPQFLLESQQEEWWPPSPLLLHVFSSRTQQWEQRSFLRRQGQPSIGTLAHIQSRLRQDVNLFLHNGTYYRGRLYVQYDNDFVMSSTDNTTAPGSDEKDLQWGNNNNKCFYTQYIRFLGFHPYKEVVFLHHSGDRGIAYHWNCSKVEDLGSLIHTTLST
ncbi:hypothetical protein PR202_gb02375 [Eleusine coracana subsp. coracana]|uniref:Uncharacterized protein n=1 Tax=Eleusine coracana subsp. coracana TaxID=191504 RepID=A0AAV5DYB7_ELECO|nr:hypothetical protein PR202_gb02375 [Eleusine coracana subsp. coracana]